VLSLRFAYRNSAFPQLKGISEKGSIPGSSTKKVLVNSGEQLRQEGRPVLTHCVPVQGRTPVSAVYGVRLPLSSQLVREAAVAVLPSRSAAAQGSG
jgi:hypothetical protein